MNEPQTSASADASAATALLTVRGVTIRFGGLVAIQSLDLEVRQGEIFALVGPNGAGKTTLLNCVSGFVRPAEGTITLDKTPLLRLGRHQRAALGIARTFQNVQLFASMTVLDNLLTAQHAQLHTNVFTGLLPFGPAISEDAAARERAHAMLAYLDLDKYATMVAGTLPSGVQKLVGVARALVLRPRLLLLDEPAAGIPHSEVTQLAASMRRWRDDLGTSVLLIEHNIPLVQSVADRICVLDYGRKLAEGLPKAVLADPQVLEAYLGRDGARVGGAGTAGASGAEEVSHVAG